MSRFPPPAVHVRRLTKFLRGLDQIATITLNRPERMNTI